MKLQDFTHDDWLRWMQATPEGITLYADDAVIDHLEKILAPTVGCSETRPPCQHPRSATATFQATGSPSDAGHRSSTTAFAWADNSNERDALADVLRGRRP